MPYGQGEGAVDTPGHSLRRLGAEGIVPARCRGTVQGPAAHYIFTAVAALFHFLLLGTEDMCFRASWPQLTPGLEFTGKQLRTDARHADSSLPHLTLPS